ncbi:MAG: phosphonate degradation HD-domain oxygenase [Actinomycetota bacterium]
MTTMPVWRELEQPAEIADALVGLFERRGGQKYSEVVTQIEHATQCAGCAVDEGSDDATVLAAFLHDIGHLLVNERDDDGEVRTDFHHEDVGARFLANWFDDAVTVPVRLHVPAKRYLCAVEPTYHDELSPASVHSLALQGGPMSVDEVADFEARPFFDAAVALRRWDEDAKVAGASAPSLDEMRARIVAYLS